MYMLAKLFEVKNTGNKGKGLFAKVPIPKGTIVSFECPKCIRISKDGFKSILTNNEKSLILRYGYRKADGSYLLPCDEIKVLDSEKGFDIVVKDIAKGEEATYDYRSFFFHDPEEFECICGEDNCCKIVRSVHDQHNPRRFEVMKIWKKSVHDALICNDKIAQPLNEMLTHIEFFKMNYNIE